MEQVWGRCGARVDRGGAGELGAAVSGLLARGVSAATYHGPPHPLNPSATRQPLRGPTALARVLATIAPWQHRGRPKLNILGSPLSPRPEGSFLQPDTLTAWSLEPSRLHLPPKAPGVKPQGTGAGHPGSRATHLSLSQTPPHCDSCRGPTGRRARRPQRSAPPSRGPR